MFNNNNVPGHRPRAIISGVRIVSESLDRRLADPFESTDVEWRVQQSGVTQQSKPWVMLIPYITSRGVQQRLDDVFGVTGWKNEFEATKDGKGYLCGLSFKHDDEWITKWDGAEYTNIEPLKGALSGATKRAAVQLGIGRYLYHLETEFARCEPVENRFNVEDGATYISIPLKKKEPKGPRIDCQWFPPAMPSWALPSVEAELLIDEVVNAKDLITLRSAFSRAYKYASSFNRGDLVKDITELKDERKEALSADSKAEDARDLMNVTVWLERAVTDEIMSADNESVLKLAKKRLAKGINQRCIDKGLDALGLLQALEKYYQAQLAKIT